MEDHLRVANDEGKTLMGRVVDLERQKTSMNTLVNDVLNKQEDKGSSYKEAELEKQLKDAKGLISQMKVAVGSMSADTATEKDKRQALAKQLAEQKQATANLEKDHKTVVIEKKEQEQAAAQSQSSADYFSRKYREVRAENEALKPEMIKLKAERDVQTGRVQSLEAEIERMKGEAKERQRKLGPQSAADYKESVDQLSETRHRAREMEKQLESPRA